MTNTKMTAGTKIWYTGDMANASGFGAISSVIDDPKWGLHYNIVMNDGRVIRGITPASFGTRPGDRFCTRAEHEAMRRAQIERMRQELAALQARRAAAAAR